MSTPGTSPEALLESVEARLEACRERRRLRGENFNVFRLLDIENKEDAHSRFIAELLDPRGSHGQEDYFLRLFLEHLGELAWRGCSRRRSAREWIQAGHNVTVEREHWIRSVVIDGGVIPRAPWS